MFVTPNAPIDGRYLEGSGLSLRRIVFGFETASGLSGFGLVRMLIRPNCVTGCACSRALTTLLGMDAMAPVPPDVPWAAASDARATTPASKTKRSQSGKFSEAMLITPYAPTDYGYCS
jgi:hypothetical protein